MPDTYSDGSAGGFPSQAAGRSISNACSASSFRQTTAVCLAISGRTGKPVHIFPLNRVSARLRAFHATLEAHGAARRFEGEIGTWDYPPLAEADRVAAEVDARLL